MLRFLSRLLLLVGGLLPLAARSQPGPAAPVPQPATGAAPASAAAPSVALPTSPPAKPCFPAYLCQLELADRNREPRVSVLQAYNLAAKDSTWRDSSLFRLNDYVVLTVRDLRLALRRDKRGFASLRLYVDDVQLPMPPVFVDTVQQRDTATVRFRLVRNADTEPTWQIFYRVPGKYEQAVSFGIGFETGQLGEAFPGTRPTGKKLQLVLVQEFWLWVGVGILGALALLFGWLARDSNFIRSDVGPVPPAGSAPGASVPVISRAYRMVPFSLSKSQVAFWSLLIISAYLMIFLVTSALPHIPSGLLGLLGISISSGFFSSFINRNPSGGAAVPPANAALLQTTLNPSRGWLTDVLTDNTNGISLSRVQFLAFNAVVALFVVRQVFRTWSLPDLDASILALISISSAGFLAQKSVESSSPKTPPPAAGLPAGAPTPPVGPGSPVAPAAPAPTTVVNVNPTPTPVTPPSPAPATPSPSLVGADGTPTARPDEDDNAAPAPTDAPATPSSSRGLG